MSQENKKFTIIFHILGAQWINPETSESYKIAFELPMGKNGKNNLCIYMLYKLLSKEIFSILIYFVCIPESFNTNISHQLFDFKNPLIN